MYRDFGLRYWEATHTWVKDYLSVRRPNYCTCTFLVRFFHSWQTTGRVKGFQTWSLAHGTFRLGQTRVATTQRLVFGVSGATFALPELDENVQIAPA